MNLYPENGFVRGLAKGAIIPALWLSLVMVMFISALCSGQRAELIVKSGHYGFISSFVFSPDGQLLASGGADGTIKLWSAGSGKQLCTLRHGRGVYSVAFSPDSQILASAGDTIKLWAVATGKELRTLQGHSDSVWSVAFSPDGQTIASASADYSIKLWEVASGKELRTFQDQSAEMVKLIAFSPNGQTVAGLRRDGAIRLWDAASLKEWRTLQGHGASSFVFSPDGETLAIASDDKTIKMWNVASRKELRTFQGYANAVSSLAFSQDGRTLASGSRDNTVKLWNVVSGEESRTLQPQKEPWPGERSVAFSPDGKTLASRGDLSGEIKRWEVASGNELPSLQGADAVGSVVFSPNSQTLVGTTSRGIMLWSLTNGIELRTLRERDSSVAFSPDSQTLASGGSASVKLWKVASGTELRTVRGHANSVTSVAFSPDGQTLASGSMDDTVKLWEVASLKELRVLKGGPHGIRSGLHGIRSVSFGPDGRTLAGAGDDIKLWEPISGKELRSFQGEGSFAFSPNGQMLASAGYERAEEEWNIKVWEVASGRELRTLPIHSGMHSNIPPIAVAFSPDGQMLASGTDNGTITLWEVGGGKELCTLRGHFSNVTSVAFSPDGKLLASGSRDATVKLWDLATKTELCSLIAVDENDWLVVTPDGLFDGLPAGWDKIIWRFSPSIYDVAPVEAFFSDFYYPGLLAEILAGKRPQAAKDIAQKDRRLPIVNLTLPDSASLAGARIVKVRVSVSEAPADKDHRTKGGAQDLRLFRNGSLVKVWRGDLFARSQQQGCKRAGEGKAICEANIRIVAGDNRFTAYAFNHDNIKSEDAAVSVSGAESLKGLKTAYIIAIGINEYANPQYNLRYADADAQAFADELQQQQNRLKQFDGVKVISLIDKEATKGNILKTLKNIASQAQPEDAVFIYFAGHGTAQGNRYYLIPHNLGYAGARTKLDQRGLETILSHSISDRELEQAFEELDARTVTLVLDTCNSGQALESEEKRHGPMNSKGLAQLAYEKGMYILTAAESFQAAREAARLGHGYLTYALVQEGLKSAAADAEPKDGEVNLREWLDYAMQRVPRMQQDALEQTRDLTHPLAFVEGEENIKDPGKRSLQTPRVFYRREPEARPLIVTKP